VKILGERPATRYYQCVVVVLRPLAIDLRAADALNFKWQAFKQSFSTTPNQVITDIASHV
jgi:hypothetical protein